MGSNFLGDVALPDNTSRILSAAELIAREGVDLHRGMNFRAAGPLLPVLLVLPRADGYKDEWHPETGRYVYEGHDSRVKDEQSSSHAALPQRDQMLMYAGGRISDNGTFYKTVREFKDGARKEALQVQIYEKLDAGVWFDKGFFNLVDAAQVSQEGRNVFKFYLAPLGATESERMMTAAAKSAAWHRSGGRCEACGSEEDLYFVTAAEGTRLLCALHSGREKRGLL